MYLDCSIETLSMHNSKLYWVLKGKNIYWLSVNIPEQDDEHPHLSYRSPPEHSLGIVTVMLFQSISRRWLIHLNLLKLYSKGKWYKFSRGTREMVVPDWHQASLKKNFVESLPSPPPLAARVCKPELTKKALICNYNVPEFRILELFDSVLPINSMISHHFKGMEFIIYFYILIP